MTKIWVSGSLQNMQGSLFLIVLTDFNLRQEIFIWHENRIRQQYQVLHSIIHLCFVIHIYSTTRSCLLLWGWRMLSMIPPFFFLVSNYIYTSLLTFKNTKIYYLCSYSRKAFAHVVAVISICYLHRDFLVPHTSNKVISIHEIQVNNIGSNKKR